MITPSFLSARSWPGFRPWLATVLGSVAVFEFLAAIAWPAGRGIPDLTTAIVTVPVATLLAMLIVAFLWSFLAQVPLSGGLSFVSKLLPLAWIFPLFDLIRSLGFGVASPILDGKGGNALAPIIDGNGYLLALVTGGLLPLDTGIMAGMRLGMFAGAVCAGLVAWALTKNAWKTLVSAFVMSGVLVKLVYFASALGLWQRITHGSGWAAGEPGVSRSILLAVTNGYWWSNIYDRFPSAVDVQAAIALRLTTAGLLVVGLGLVLAVAFIWTVPAWKRVCRHVYRSWSMLDLALYAVGGGVLYALFTKSFRLTGMDWSAFALFLLLLAALRLASALERSLSRLREDERANADQPVARGDVSPDVAEDVISVALLYVLVSSWVLGWPVFAAVLVHLAASHLTRDRSWPVWPWLATVFRSVGAAALTLSGLFFITQSANTLTVAAIAVCCLAAAHRLVVEFAWIPWKSRH
ncbi:MAG TPA: hypothetical protein VN397_03535 [Candidatus Methylomirabilis sp.]|nr:hypothetical protein [Candidatus Methylomirabilis sp.]